MPASLKLNSRKTTPKYKGDPGDTTRVEVAAVAFCKRTTDGVIGMEIRRGDGAPIETYTYIVRCETFAVTAGTLVQVGFGTIDFITGKDFTPRGYQVEWRALAGGDMSVDREVIHTNPYAPT